MRACSEAPSAGVNTWSLKDFSLSAARKNRLRASLHAAGFGGATKAKLASFLRRKSSFAASAMARSSERAVATIRQPQWTGGVLTKTAMRGQSAAKSSAGMIR